VVLCALAHELRGFVLGKNIRLCEVGVNPMFGLRVGGWGFGWGYAPVLGAALQPSEGSFMRIHC